MTVSSCFLIWLETVRDQPVPTLPIYTSSLPSFLPRYSAATPVGSLTNPTTGNFPFWTVLIFSQASVRADQVWRVGPLGHDAFKIKLASVLEHLLTVADEVVAVKNRQEARYRSHQ